MSFLGAGNPRRPFFQACTKRGKQRKLAPIKTSHGSGMEKDRMAVLAAIIEQGVIPVFYHPDTEVCVNVIRACSNGPSFWYRLPRLRKHWALSMCWMGACGNRRRDFAWRRGWCGRRMGM